ncbi:mitochondrial ribosomal protein S25-domain-containing protein [Tuber borchii]|uniref:37S ribosomal protein S25, mitochondrial n=1 Tax=Tuber borchii TaxID=42251 RepID=A0A2T6ZP99_TUBBO|nr:mitochondrial ribosomal protein S25-domain-containing protein [Tuber borchii]
MINLRRFRSLRVHQNASQMLEAGRLQEEPAWYRIVGSIPPTTSLVRIIPPQLKERKKPWTKNHRPSRMYMPQKIEYPEDKLRTQFYRDHPWELARPRVLVENDGKDYLKYDWSKMPQKGKPLDGESVVQRQLWLRGKYPEMSAEKAYDMARKEFYDLRLQEDIERRIAVEEARACGATFGKTYLELGIEMEEKYLEQWRKDTIAFILRRRQRQSTFKVIEFTSASTEEGFIPAIEAEEGEGGETIEPEKAAVAIP